MIMTSNRGFGEWADIFGDAVVATALLDRLLHHAVVIPIEGNSYRLREHADLLPEHLRNRGLHPKRPRRRRPNAALADLERTSPRPCRADDPIRLGWGNLLRPNWGNLRRC